MPENELFRYEKGSITGTLSTANSFSYKDILISAFYLWTIIYRITSYLFLRACSLVLDVEPDVELDDNLACWVVYLASCLDNYLAWIEASYLALSMVAYLVL